MSTDLAGPVHGAEIVCVDSMHTNSYIQVIYYILAVALYPQQQLWLRIYKNHSGKARDGRKRRAGGVLKH